MELSWLGSENRERILKKIRRKLRDCGINEARAWLREAQKHKEGLRRRDVRVSEDCEKEEVAALFDKDVTG